MSIDYLNVISNKTFTRKKVKTLNEWFTDIRNKGKIVNWNSQIKLAFIPYRLRTSVNMNNAIISDKELTVFGDFLSDIPQNKIKKLTAEKMNLYFNIDFITLFYDHWILSSLLSTFTLWSKLFLVNILLHFCPINAVDNVPFGTCKIPYFLWLSLIFLLRLLINAVVWEPCLLPTLFKFWTSLWKQQVLSRGRYI